MCKAPHWLKEILRGIRIWGKGRRTPVTSAAEFDYAPIVRLEGQWWHSAPEFGYAPIVRRERGASM